MFPKQYILLEGAIELRDKNVWTPSEKNSKSVRPKNSGKRFLSMCFFVRKKSEKKITSSLFGIHVGVHLFPRSQKNMQKSKKIVFKSQKKISNCFY